MGGKKITEPMIREGESFKWPSKISPERRNILLATAGVGAVGGAVAHIPIICSMLPSERAKAAGAPITVDISGLQEGQVLSAEWQKKPIWILRRTAEMLSGLEEVEKDGKLQDLESQTSAQQENCKNANRSIKPEVLVVIASCTHLGCLPKNRFENGESEGMFPEWRGGFFCPCHSSWFDLAGRVYQGLPAPINLAVPPHYYIDDNTIYIGSETPVA